MDVQAGRGERFGTVLGPLGAFGLFGCLLLGFAGAAARPGGMWLGVPSMKALAIAVIAAAVLLATRRGRSALVACCGLLVPLVLLALGGSWAGVRAVSGPVLLGMAAAGAIVVFSRVGRWPGRLMFLPLAFLVLLLAAGRSHVRVGPRGDEPHYLMVAESLLRDHDLSLERDYGEGRYAQFHDAPLVPHYRVRGRHGEIYSLHAVGLSVLILPAWAIAGYAGVTIFMALIAALLAGEVREWVASLTGREDLADAAGWLFILSPPLLHYAGLVFTEVPAALAFTYGLRRGGQERVGVKGAFGIGLAAAVLPWLNVRYLLLAGLVLLHAAWRHRRPSAVGALALPAVASAIGLAAYHFALYGFWNPARVYGRRPEMSFAQLREGLPGLLLDQEFGLLVYAPAFILALPGLGRLVRRDGRLGLASLAAVAAVLLSAGAWHMWRGGFNPPGRFLVPIAPVLVVSAALVFEGRRLTAGTALLLGWGLWTGITGALQPQLVHRDRDDVAPLFRTMSGAREWTGLLPGYVLGEGRRHRLAGVWAGVLLLAIPWRRRALGPGRLGAASLGLVAAAQLAAGLGTGKGGPTGSTDDRDSVRLVGRRALEVPGWSLSAADGRWTPSALGWGPLYAPHRHPAGADVGRRLPLPAGLYQLELEGEVLSTASDLPALEVVPEGPGAPARLVTLARERHGASATFALDGRSPATTLRLRGGGPILVKAVRLRGQPFSGPAV